MIKPCEKCGGAGWLWWFELKNYHNEYVKEGYYGDDTKYVCDYCDGEGLDKNLEEE